MKIVKIIDSSSLIINAGHNYGIRKGDKFRIIGKEKNEVIDPDTKQSLGALQNIKGHIIADVVYEKMTVCTSIPKPQNTMGLQAMLNPAILPDLNVDADEITGGVNSEDKEIRVGDEVIKDLG